MTEILKQPDSHPISFERQAVILYIATKGYFTDFEVEELSEFQSKVFDKLDSSYKQLVQDINEEMWDNMINSNLKSAYMLSRTVIPPMLNKKKGCILNIASMWGQVGASCEVHYSASKGGLIAMTKALAKELGPSGIRVNCIAPGVIQTTMLNHFTKHDLNIIREETPLGRLGSVEDIANAALFLTDKAASFITGQILGVNGGSVI
jgi:3-oxoacyl-[acyl-carrier protein] reductase